MNVALPLLTLVIGILLLLFGNVRNWVGGSYKIYIKFRSAPGVSVDTPIRKSGIRIGRVTKVEFAPDNDVLITAAIFVAVPRDHEEAAQIFGASPLRAFVQVTMPQALPGIAAAAMFTFVMSWNEVLGAAILTLNQRTLPAQVLSTLGDSPLAFRYAGGFALVLPALLFVAVMRRYLLNMWGTTLR